MTTSRTPARLLAGGAVAGALTLMAAAPASAHVTVTPSDTAAGAYTVLTFSNGHGCEGSPTTAITIEIPEGINAVSPTRNPFYDVEKQIEQLDEPVTDSHGNEVTERVATVTYTATTPLPDGYRDAFELSLQLPDAEGETLAFPTVQTCEEGETAWVEIPAEGQDADELENPAPALTITEAGEGHHGGAASHDEEEAAELDAEPAAAESAEAGDDSDPLAMAGLGVGALALVVGGLALARGRRTT